MSPFRNKLVIRFKPNPDSDALSGRFFGHVFPGLKPMGCFVFALRAMQNVQAADAAW